MRKPWLAATVTSYENFDGPRNSRERNSRPAMTKGFGKVWRRQEEKLNNKGAKTRR